MREEGSRSESLFSYVDLEARMGKNHRFEARVWKDIQVPLVLEVRPLKMQASSEMEGFCMIESARTFADLGWRILIFCRDSCNRSRSDTKVIGELNHDRFALDVRHFQGGGT
jgi:hypothetical protein